MNLRHIGWVAVLASIALAGCSSSSSDSSSGSGGDPLIVTGTSGNDVNMTGTWTRLCSGSSPSSISTQTFSGGTNTVVNRESYSDATCTTVDVTLDATVTYTLDSVVDPISWIDGTGSASTAPTGITATAGNGLTETFTSASMTPNTAVGAGVLNTNTQCGATDWTVGVAKDVLDCFIGTGTAANKVSWVVDDAAAELNLYAGDDTVDADADGYPTGIENSDPLVK